MTLLSEKLSTIKKVSSLSSPFAMPTFFFCSRAAMVAKLQSYIFLDLNPTEKGSLFSGIYAQIQILLL
jgi:hypothetical protein